MSTHVDVLAMAREQLSVAAEYLELDSVDRDRVRVKMVASIQ